MKIISIQNIIRKDVPIYYKRFYKGTLLIELLNKPQEVPIEFIIEHKPTGYLETTITFSEKIDYPLIPIIRDLKIFIGELDSSRKLPA